LVTVAQAAQVALAVLVEATVLALPFVAAVQVVLAQQVEAISVFLALLPVVLVHLVHPT
jgi:hypothetical protein